MINLNLSVHDVVDLILRKGHLDNRIFNYAAMQEGSRIHKEYQDRQDKNYFSEYYLSDKFVYEEYVLNISGRADGIILKENGEYIVDEIKSTVSSLDSFIADHGQWHLGQAMFYGYMLAKNKNLNKVEIQMTYISQINSKEIKQINKEYTLKDLELFTQDVVIEFVRFYKKIYKLKQERDKSISKFLFPFPTMRKGQKEMIDFVSNTIDLSSSSFIEAPTGIGKTISVLYPSCKHLKINEVSSIFYLTNKNAIKRIAVETVKLFQEHGSKIKSIQFTSKDNICLNEKKKRCNPDECFLAKFYYDKLNNAISDCLEYEDTFSFEYIKEFCLERNICPFQFQLDLANYCDVLICDYSYIFNVNDFLGISDLNSSFHNSILCIDESHNLPERIREMYSSEINVSYLLDMFPLFSLHQKKLKKIVEDLIDYLQGFDVSKLELDEENMLYVLQNVDINIVTYVSDIISEFRKQIKNYPLEISDELLNYYYYFLELNNLLKLITGEMEKYFIFYLIIDEKKEIISYKIRNISPSEIITLKTSRFKSTIFFSATLSPKEFYIDLLGGDYSNKDSVLVLPSPFDKKNRRVFIDNRFSLYFKDREKTIPYIYRTIVDAISQKTGNYFVFVPSYAYLNRLKEFFVNDEENSARIHYQGQYMSESERKSFLEYFSKDNKETHVGIVVLHGVFSEGIDLVGDRLIGAIVISTGIPSLSFEKNKEAEFYSKNKENINGFEYAYTYPGINKILQAGGRVIRSEEDRGFILYIDSRLNNGVYRKISKEIFPDAIYLSDNNQLKKELNSFFNEDK